MLPRSAYRPFAVTLARRTRLSDNFFRLTFTGPALDEFADTCLDQRIKLVFGTDAQLDEAAATDDWATWWREQPNESRPVMRTYTARYVRRDAREVDVDFVTHGSEGPASRFALNAEPGAPLVIVGAYADHPEADTQGLAWRRDGAPSVLLVGDETAQPAIANILRSLPAHVTGAAFVEVPSPGDAMEMDTAAEVAVTYLPRSRSDVRGSLLSAAVFAWADERTGEQADGSATGPSTTGTSATGRPAPSPTTRTRRPRRPASSGRRVQRVRVCGCGSPRMRRPSASCDADCCGSGALTGSPARSWGTGSRVRARANESPAGRDSKGTLLLPNSNSRHQMRTPIRASGLSPLEV